jgi:hypothetical protein
MAFLRDVVLKQEGVEKWIRDTLSIQATGKLIQGKFAWKPPRIWVCTGLQLIKHGKVKYSTVNSHSGGGGINLDAGLITTGIPTGQSAAEFHGHLENSTHVDNDYDYDDERVWAAQWMEIGVVFRSKGPNDKEKPMVVDLKQIEHLEHGVRTPEQTPETAINSNGANIETRPEVAEIVGLKLPLDNSNIIDESNQEEEVPYDLDSIVFDSRPYTEAMDGIDWKRYEKYRTYLETVN